MLDIFFSQGTCEDARATGNSGGCGASGGESEEKSGGQMGLAPGSNGDIPIAGWFISWKILLKWMI